MHTMASRDRAFFRRIVAGPNGCHVWTGATTSSGYGLVVRLGQVIVTHRVAYELMFGPIPELLVIDHLCRNRLCANPRHMEPVTSGENVLRGISPSARNARMTECDKGHPFDDENTYVCRGRRHCRTCRRDYMAAYYKQRQVGN